MHDFLARDSTEIDQVEPIATIAFIARMQINQPSFQPLDDLWRIYRQSPKKFVHLAIVHGQHKEVVPGAERGQRHLLQQGDVLTAEISVKPLAPSGYVINEGERPGAPACIDADFFKPVAGLWPAPGKSRYEFKAQGGFAVTGRAREDHVAEGTGLFRKAVEQQPSSRVIKGQLWDAEADGQPVHLLGLHGFVFGHGTVRPQQPNPFLPMRPNCHMT